LLQEKLSQNIEFMEKDVALVGMPVFAGRIPQVCLESLQRLQGKKTAAIVYVVYGNREYEDALLELKEVMEEQGFMVIGAAAFIAHHSMFRKVAVNRPDQSDLQRIKNFAGDCVDKLKLENTGQWEALRIPGNHPYRDYSEIPVQPWGDDRCDDCGICVELCPVHAIDPKNPRETDKAKCISCTACMAACPQKARDFHSPIYGAVCEKFEKLCAIRKEPETFL
ncbi:MAG: 4Fe-4S binding protein, partial [Anaerovorax sp.]